MVSRALGNTWLKVDWKSRPFVGPGCMQWCSLSAPGPRLPEGRAHVCLVLRGQHSVPRRRDPRGRVGWWRPSESRSPCPTVLLTCSVIRACFTLSLGLSFPICTIEADASQALPGSELWSAAANGKVSVLPRGLLAAPAFRLPPSGSRGSALSSERPRPLPAPRGRR